MFILMCESFRVWPLFGRDLEEGTIRRPGCVAEENMSPWTSPLEVAKRGNQIDEPMGVRVRPDAYRVFRYVFKVFGRDWDIMAGGRGCFSPIIK
jgi:hypothetical protein